jgi:hypothetical protein
MKTIRKPAIAVAVLCLGLASCGFFVSEWNALKTWSPWARTVGTEGNVSLTEFNHTFVDASGNVYATCYVRGGTGYDFGSAVRSAPVLPGWDCSALVKYDRDGNAVSATTAVTGSSVYLFKDLVCDSAGNVLIGGSVSGNQVFDFGNSVTTQGSNAGGSNFSVFKYDAQGRALWARTALNGTSNSQVEKIAVDGAGNVYCIGYLMTNAAAEYDFGGGVRVSVDANVLVTGIPVLVKYNAEGSAQWARKPFSAPYGGSYKGLAVDSAGNAYASMIIGSGHAGSYDFGNGVALNVATSDYLSLIVKYDPSGQALWAVPLSGAGMVDVNSLCIAPDGNIIAGGDCGADEIDFKGTILPMTATGGIAGAMVCKISPAGAPLWARSIAAAGPGSVLLDLVCDSQGSILACGYVHGTGTVDFGSGVSVNGAYSGSPNCLFAKYDSSGGILMARTVAIGPNTSQFAGISVDASGNAYLCGALSGSGDYNFGGDLNVSGTATATNAVLVKYLGRN